MLEMLQPHNPPRAGQYIEHLFYAIDGKKSQQFSVDSISDLHNVNVISMFPSLSRLDLLVSATKEAGQPSSDPPKYSFYLARFSLDGAYKESVPLPTTYSPYRLAILPSGQAIVSGYDETNLIPRVTLIGQCPLDFQA
jgi:hypothetical protein